MEQCVIPATNSLFMETGGSVLSAPIMTCAQFAIIVISTILGIGFTESLPLVLKGTPACFIFIYFFCLFPAWSLDSFFYFQYNFILPYLHY